MKKILFVLLMIPLLLTGCATKEGVTTPTTYAQDIAPSLLLVGDLSENNGYCYLVDKNTGVVYLEFNSYQRHAITLMVNADGDTDNGRAAWHQVLKCIGGHEAASKDVGVLELS